MDSRSPLARHQSDFLTEVWERSLCKDSAFMSKLASLGGPGDMATICKWRKGERMAPLGILPIMLSHVDDPAAVLDIIGRPHGLATQKLKAPVADDQELLGRALKIGALAGSVQQAVIDAHADGTVDEEEDAKIYEAAQAAVEKLQEIMAHTAPKVLRMAK